MVIISLLRIGFEVGENTKIKMTSMSVLVYPLKTFTLFVVSQCSKETHRVACFPSFLSHNQLHQVHNMKAITQ